jgi:hypothetical protein
MQDQICITTERGALASLRCRVTSIIATIEKHGEKWQIAVLAAAMSARSANRGSLPVRVQHPAAFLVISRRSAAGAS